MLQPLGKMGLEMSVPGRRLRQWNAAERIHTGRESYMFQKQNIIRVHNLDG